MTNLFKKINILSNSKKEKVLKDFLCQIMVRTSKNDLAGKPRGTVSGLMIFLNGDVWLLWKVKILLDLSSSYNEG